MPGADQRISKTEHLSSQKRAHLRAMAGIAGMDYIADVLKAETLMNAVKAVAKTRPQVVKYSLSPWFALAALLLLIVAYYPARRRQ